MLKKVCVNLQKKLGKKLKELYWIPKTFGKSVLPGKFFKVPNNINIPQPRKPRFATWMTCLFPPSSLLNLTDVQTYRQTVWTSAQNLVHSERQSTILPPDRLPRQPQRQHKQPDMLYAAWQSVYTARLIAMQIVNGARQNV